MKKTTTKKNPLSRGTAKKLALRDRWLGAHARGKAAAEAQRLVRWTRRPIRTPRLTKPGEDSWTRGHLVDAWEAGWSAGGGRLLNGRRVGQLQYAAAQLIRAKQSASYWQGEYEKLDQEAKEAAAKAVP